MTSAWPFALNLLISFQDELHSILNIGCLFAVLLVGQVSFGILAGWILKSILKDPETLATLAFLGGLLGFGLFFLALTWLKLPPKPGMAAPIFLVALTILFMGRNQLKAWLSIELVWLVLFFGLILWLRLLFVQDLLVPPYADSVQHVAIVRDMLNPGQPPQAFYRVASDLNRYYHFGFHALAAWLGGVSGLDPVQTILLLGQYFQALVILGLYPLARIALENRLTAWLVMGSGGLLLPLPAYASNWGKYPAIASLVGVCFVLSLLFIYLKTSSPGKTLPRKLHWLMSISILAAFFLHSRTVILFLMMFLLGLAFYRAETRQAGLGLLFKNENIANPKIIFAIALSILSVMTVLALDLPFHPLFGVFLLGALLISFYTNFILTLFLASCWILAAAFAIAPMDIEPFFSLLDRPYVAIFLYIPVSFFIGMALRQLLKINQQLTWRKFGFFIVSLFAIFFALFLQDHRPDICCVFVTDDDLFSFEWIRQNIPAGAVIAISATGQPGNFLPADGGAWIEPITSVPTRRIRFDTDFFLETEQLCQNGLEYVYVDALANSFDAYILFEAGAKQVLGFGSVSIYQLDCH